MAEARRRNGSADYLRHVRASLGLSRKEAARSIGCSVGTLGRYERDGIPRGARFNRFMGICKGYGIDADQLHDLITREA